MSYFGLAWSEPHRASYLLLPNCPGDTSVVSGLRVPWLHRDPAGEGGKCAFAHAAQLILALCPSWKHRRNDTMKAKGSSTEQHWVSLEQGRGKRERHLGLQFFPRDFIIPHCFSECHGFFDATPWEILCKKSCFSLAKKVEGSIFGLDLYFIKLIQIPWTCTKNPWCTRQCGEQTSSHMTLWDGCHYVCRCANWPLL
jgi:hypothetical protein